MNSALTPICTSSFTPGCNAAKRPLWEIAQHSFAEAEIAALRGLTPDDLCDRFYDCWTLKKAYLKARGLGLRLPLDQFAILFSGPAIGISFTREIDDDPKRWHFTRHSPSPRHRLAIADGSGTPGGLPITMRPWPVPLV
ncbi:4'-phosphopantetheinyl transferase superfamily protein [Bradyrhizobium sp. Leo170]|uniref:4'-phosphopantetheinyl transferase family protein n=1 Tax=Bradyrhizobium sp. Leo170 TaxID=1571199 RepID=UPI0024C0AE9B|nr:4'-phosphopantetheinyl transferase superfamily protein [Bradyrhizobium sp. Leo170]